jgi:hypothetical protein
MPTYVIQDDEEMEEVYAADDGTCQSEDTNKFDAVVQALEGEDA